MSVSKSRSIHRGDLARYRGSLTNHYDILFYCYPDILPDIFLLYNFYNMRDGIPVIKLKAMRQDLILVESCNGKFPYEIQPVNGAESNVIRTGDMVIYVGTNSIYNQQLFYYEHYGELCNLYRSPIHLNCPQHAVLVANYKDVEKLSRVETNNQIITSIVEYEKYVQQINEMTNDLTARINSIITK